MGYVTVSQSIRSNGDRHAANAKRHLAEGHPEYAAGSMRKAERNWKRADDLDEWMRPRNQFEARMRQIMADAVAETLFTGG